MNLKNYDKNILAVGIGVGLMILVALITFWKPLADKKTSLSPETSVQNGNLTKKDNLIDAADLISKMAVNEDLIVVDTRSEADFVEEHIINSKNISSASLTSSVPLLDKGKSYVIIGYEMSGEDMRALDALFNSNGLNPPQYLNGGLDAWKTAYGMTISDGNPNSFADQSKVNYIKSDRLNELLSKNEEFFIIDLRKESQYAEGHIENATNIFLDDLEAKKGKIPPGKKIILYDNDGLRAFKGAVRLYDLGFFNVLALSDGLNAWRQKGFEIIK